VRITRASEIPLTIAVEIRGRRQLAVARLTWTSRKNAASRLLTSFGSSTRHSIPDTIDANQLPVHECVATKVPTTVITPRRVAIR